MCGFTGFLSGNRVFEQVAMQTIIEGMTRCLVHRGPDDEGIWIGESSNLALGHRRLSILDLSPAGHQPMASSSGRFVIAFNGEVYNHLNLRTQLSSEGVESTWRGHSDTETLLAGFEHWGVVETLAKCVGMFAFALWDRANQALILGRDRFGEKPLYYGWSGGAFLFGSELKALRAFPEFSAEISREALAQYLRFCYVPAPRSIYEGIYKLEPGCVLTISGAPPSSPPLQPIRPGERHGSLAISRWYSFADTVETSAGHQHDSEAVALSDLESTLEESVQLQSLADVPLGAFLSGGVDSSAVVALMQNQSSRPVKTFTIGFDEAGFDESPHAKAVAEHLGTEHHEMRVSAKMAQDVIPQLPWMYDEPFADSSQIPTHLVCKAAKEHVTVALSGDAGDELFGGYNRYFWGPRIWNKLGSLPKPVRRSLGGTIGVIPISFLNSVGRSLLGSEAGSGRLGDKLHKLSHRLKTVDDLDSLYRSLVSEWDEPASLIQNFPFNTTFNSLGLLNDLVPERGVEQSPLPMMYQDTLTYLPDDILCKVDRAAMACSLETRVPFLDHRVVEQAWRLPLDMKIRVGQGKWALRQILYKYVPKELIERPKAGFAVPIGQWLRGPLRDWAEDLLSENRLQSEGYLHPEPIRKVWKEHLAGRRDHTARLWTILMFQSWLESTRGNH